MGINTPGVSLIIHFNFSLSLEKREDIGEEETIERKICLEQSLEKLNEVMYFCEEKYKCSQQLLHSYYAWSTDTIPISSCNDCGNCQHKAVDNPELINITSDASRIANIVEKMKEEFDDVITHDDIIATHLLDDLITKKIICEVKLYKSSVGFWTLDSKIVGIAEEAESMIYST
ncbi:11364_t:CDS:2, partial [Entrophospora sp. SA101]